MDNPERVLNAITKLLSPFPAGNTQGTADEVLRRYLDAVEEFYPFDIEDGVDLLMKAKIPGYDGRFAPTPPQLATASRVARDKRLDAMSRERRLRPALPPPDIEKTPEQRARAKAKVAEFVASVSPDPQDEATIAIRNARWAKVNAHFDPPQDEDSLTERLHLKRGARYSVGSPESDDAAA